MTLIHKRIFAIIFLLVLCSCYFCDIKMTETVATTLVTFFSVVFGFYMTTIAILYNSSYAKTLYKQIDNQEQKRGIHKLKSYLSTSGYWSIASIALIIIYITLATKNDLGNFVLGYPPYALPICNFSINLELLVPSIIFSFSVVNVFFMLLLLRAILNGLIYEAASTDNK